MKEKGSIEQEGRMRKGDGSDMARWVNWIAATLFARHRGELRGRGWMETGFADAYGRNLARENVELTTLYPLTSGNGCKKVSSAFCLPCIFSSRYREILEASRLSPLSSSRSQISLPYPFLPVSFW